MSWKTINYTNLRIAKWSTNAIDSCNSAIQNLQIIIEQNVSNYQKDLKQNAINNLTSAISCLTELAKDALYNIEAEKEK